MEATAEYLEKLVRNYRVKVHLCMDERRFVMADWYMQEIDKAKAQISILKDGNKAGS